MMKGGISQFEERFFRQAESQLRPPPSFGLFLAALLIIFFSPDSHSTDSAGSASYGVGLGYGASRPGWGATTEKVETVDLVFRYESLPEGIKGYGWYKNQRSFLIEVPLHAVRSSYDSFMLGISFLSRWTFERNNMKPYVLVGGGPVYSIANVKGMSSNMNGSYQAGIGLEFTINSRRYFTDIRYHHISNGGTKEPNVPLNSSKILFGIVF